MIIPFLPFYTHFNLSLKGGKFLVCTEAEEKKKEKKKEKKLFLAICVLNLQSEKPAQNSQFPSPVFKPDKIKKGFKIRKTLFATALNIS